MKLIDTVIVGGGLAGSAAALHLAKKGYSVLILEKEKKTNIISCAGGMASSVQKFLPLDISSCIETEVKNVQFTWKTSDRVVAELDGESPFVIIRRENLDRLLIKAALSYGANIKRNIFVKETYKSDNSWIIKCDKNFICKSKFLIIADGSESRLSTKLNLGPQKPKYAKTFALRLDNLGNIPEDSVRFDFGSIKYGFAWAFPLKDALNIGCGTFIGNTNLKDFSLYDELIGSFGFKNLQIDPTFQKLRIWNGFHKLHGDRVLAVGDAASLCDPFLAEGIRPSLISSFYAAECIDKCLTDTNKNLSEYTNIINKKWGTSMAWGKRIAEVFYRFPRTGYKLGVKRKTAPKRIAQILSGEMSYADIAGRVIKRLLFFRTD